MKRRTFLSALGFGAVATTLPFTATKPETDEQRFYRMARTGIVQGERFSGLSRTLHIQGPIRVLGCEFIFERTPTFYMAAHGDQPIMVSGCCFHSNSYEPNDLQFMERAS